MVVIGGAHATCLPESTLDKTNADFVIIGEAEISLFELSKAIQEKASTQNIPGVMPNKNRKITSRPQIQDLDSLPFPDWQQLNPNFYKKAPHGGLIKSFPVAPITSTRGCPFECSFCASPHLWDKKIRFRSPENIVDEIEYLVHTFNVREIHFEDDNLTLKKSHIEGICNEILKRNLKIHWATPNGIRADTIDPELLKLMKKSGCYSIAFGIESGSQEILNRVNKRSRLETVKNAVSLARSLGIVTQGFFIFGLPGENSKTLRQTIDFSKNLGLDKAQFLILDILPGSQLWNELIKDKENDCDYKSYQEAMWVPEGLDKELLNSMPARAFRSFFLRPRQMFFLLRYFRFSQIPFILRRVVDFNILSFKKRAAKH